MADRRQSDESDFLLADEIRYCIEGFSCALDLKTTLNFTHDESLPQKVSGDLEKFRLVVSTMVEFALKYGSPGVISVSSQCNGYDKNMARLLSLSF